MLGRKRLKAYLMLYLNLLPGIMNAHHLNDDWETTQNKLVVDDKDWGDEEDALKQTP